MGQRKWLVVVVGLAVALVAGGWWVIGRRGTAPLGGQLTVVDALASTNADFKQVTEPRSFSFPADHGPHPGYQTEWWYYTGNLDSADGRHWGYQLTFFRRALLPQPQARASEWGTDALYMAHFTVTDVAGQQFYAYERFSRDGAGLAGAHGEPFRVFLQGWSATGPETAMRVVAAEGPVAIDLELRSSKPPVLQGDQGLSQKSSDAGNASYYYSLTRMETTGTIKINGSTVQVTGTSWMDREWSTSALGTGVVGWDWFALHLDDGRELMYYQLRRKDGTSDPLSSGTLIAPDGSATKLRREAVQLEVLDHWSSSRTGTTYPSGWRMRVPVAELDVEVRPYLSNQELPLTVTYWEGASRVTGTSNGQAITGNGYVELTGYGEQGAAPVQTR